VSAEDTYEVGTLVKFKSLMTKQFDMEYGIIIGHEYIAGEIIILDILCTTGKVQSLPLICEILQTPGEVK